MRSGLPRSELVNPFAIRVASWWKVPGAYASRALANNTLILTPFPVVSEITLDGIATQVTAAGQSGAVLHLGIYLTDLSTVTPTHTLVLDAGTVAADAIAVPELAIDQTLAPGWYSLAILQTGAASTQASIQQQTLEAINPYFESGGLSTLATRGTGALLSAATVTALPATVATTQNGYAFPPFVAIKRSA